MFKIPVFMIFTALLSGNVALPTETEGGNDLVTCVEEVRPIQGRTVQPLQINRPFNAFPQADAVIYSDYRNSAYFSAFEMLMGRVAGVWVSGNMYHYTVRIRNAAGPPLVVIDNMPYTGYNDQELNNLMMTIAPQDVDRIEVIKNSVGAIRYGPNAGNGVIVIHTKRGGEELGE